MQPSTFEFVLENIGEKLRRSSDGHEMVSAEKQLLLSLWRFATPDSYRSYDISYYYVISCYYISINNC